MADSPGQMVVCYFIPSNDVERSARFYTDVLGGTVVFGPVPTNVAWPTAAGGLVARQLTARGDSLTTILVSGVEVGNRLNLTEGPRSASYEARGHVAAKKLARPDRYFFLGAIPARSTSVMSNQICDPSL